MNRSGVVDAAGDQRRCDEAGQTEFALQAHDGRGVGRFDLELGRHGSHTSHARIRIVHVPLSHNRTAKSPAKERAARAGSRDPASQPQDPAIPLRTHISATPADHTSPLWAQNGTHDNFQRDSSTLQRLQLAKPQVVNNPHARPSVKSPSELPWVAFCAHEHRGAPIESPA